jgi:signal transduction histidine kinase/HAMP domain-containing protein/ActR/RegA family two-component response regulator
MLRFSHRIILQPVLAAAAFMLIIGVSQHYSRQNRQLLAQVQDGYAPAMVLGRDLGEDLAAVQRGLLDLVSAEEPGRLGEMDGVRDRFLQRLRSGRDNGIVDRAELGRIEREFTDYYALARDAALQMLAGARGEAMQERLQQMVERYNALAAHLETFQGRTDAAMADALRAARESLHRSAQRVSLIIVLCLAVLGALAWGAIRSVTRPIAALVDAAQGLGGGELGRRVAVARDDEIGVLAGSFNRMADDIGTLLREREDARRALEAANASLEQRVVELRRELLLNATLADVGKTLLSVPDDLRPVAATILAKAQGLTTSACGFASSLDGRGDMRVLATAGMGPGAPDADAPLTREARAVHARSWGAALDAKAPFFDNGPCGLPEGAAPHAGHPGIARFLSVPCIYEGRSVGLIALANAGRDYDRHDLAALERLADLFTLAIVRGEGLREKEELAAQLRHAHQLEAIGTLAGGIAHDFNNILTPMSGYAELAQLSLPAGSKGHAQLEQVLAACARARDLVAQILGFSRRTEEARRPLRVQQVVAQALKLVRSAIPPSIEIRQSLDPRCRPVLADETQLHQVVMNLCTNAFHAMRERGGVLSVTLEEVQVGFPDARSPVPPGTYVRLGVSDTGVGIDAATLERIFDPYFTTKPKGEGTGLGLALVQGIVKKHGGAIRVDSRPGAGTAVTVLLPAIDADGAAAPGTAAGTALPRGCERVVVVDDERTTVEFIREVLEGLGYRALGFDESPRALAAFLRDPSGVDLVITDLRMPALSGVDLAERLHRERPDLPILLCSGNTEGLDAAAAAAHGIGAILEKPFTVQELAGAVRELLRSAPPQGRGEAVTGIARPSGGAG